MKVGPGIPINGAPRPGGAAILDALMSNPATPGTVIPFALAVVLTAVIRFVGGTTQGRALAIAAAVVAFLVAFLIIESLPPFPPAAAKQKVFYLVLLALVVGLVLDLSGAPRPFARGALLLFPLIGLAWIGWRPLVAGPDVQLILRLAVLWLVSAAILWRLMTLSDRGALGPGVQVLVAAAGTAFVALLGNSASLGVLASSVAAATGGVLSWAFLAAFFSSGRYGFGSVGVLGTGGALLTLVYVLVLFTETVNLIALAVLALVFAADRVAARMPPRRALGRVAQPVVLAALAAIPAAAAVGVALIAQDTSPY